MTIDHTPEYLNGLLHELCQLPNETEWVEFKHNYFEPHELGEYVSALANSAKLHHKEHGYLCFGIEDKTHNIVGTSFRYRKEKFGNEELENWILHLLNPRIDVWIFELAFEGKPVTLFQIDSAMHRPVAFDGIEYIRVGSYKKKLKDYPEKEQKIWDRMPDWSSQICTSASMASLDEFALKKAREEYKKRKKGASDVDKWDDITFLNKAKLAIEGKISNAAILLLGKSEASSLLSPAIAQISWFLRDEHNDPKDYEHFESPLVLAVDKVLAKIRNLNVRVFPRNSLFPMEMTQYDPSVIREALHNCIAHQDYEMNSRINVVETPDEVIFENAGSFIPGSVEAVIERDAPPKFYRNRFLAQAMVNLGMIETEGGGIREMFNIQRNRSFPLPTYELDDPNTVRVRIPGKILDENYTRLLLTKTDMNLHTVILLDRVQKKKKISKEDRTTLKRKNLVEGRYPNLFVSSGIADISGEKISYIKNRPFDKKYYKDMITGYLEKYKEASRRDINGLLLEKLSSILSSEQKLKKISNVLSEMARDDKSIANIGTFKKPRWVLKREEKK